MKVILTVLTTENALQIPLQISGVARELLQLPLRVKNFNCGEDDEGDPIIEQTMGIDLTNYLTPDPCM